MTWPIFSRQIGDFSAPPNWTIPPNTVVGRLGSDLIGPAQAIPIVELSSGYVNALSFPGVDPTGNTDSTAGLQAAIDTAFNNVQKGFNVSGAITQQILFIPAGLYLVSAPLSIVSALGIVITGAGRYSTTIENTAANNTIFSFNGAAFCVIERMNLTGVSNGDVGINLDWDGNGAGISTQSNTIRDMAIQNLDTGVLIGFSGFQCSETLFENCFIENCVEDGIAVQNGNALNQTVIGGTIGHNNVGVHVYSGSAPNITGVAFEGNTSYDIQVDNSSSDAYNISGCRSESVNFANFVRGNAVINGCLHFGSSPGVFFNSGGFHPATLIACTSRKGTITGGTAGVSLIGCAFNLANFSDGNSQGSIENSYYNFSGDTASAGTYVFDAFWFGTGSAIQTLPPSPGSSVLPATTGSIASNAALGNLFTVTLTGNATLANPTNLSAGWTYNWVITQGAGGSFTLAYGSTFTFPGGVTPTLSTIAGSVDMLTAVYDGTALRASLQKAFAT